MWCMQTEKYIKNRLLPDIVRAVCAQKQITVTAYSDDWVLRLSKGDSSAWIYGYHFDINSGAANQIANDKVATYLVLQAAGIPAVAHYLLRSEAREAIVSSKIMKGVPSSKNPFVIKPLSGSSGKHLRYVMNLAEGIDIVRKSGAAAWAASLHEDISKEFRIVVVDGKTELIYEKTHPLRKGELKLFNLGLGAKAVDVSEDSSMHEKLSVLATRASAALRLRSAAVDVVQLATGKQKVLEINSGISFEHYARQSQQNNKKAKLVYEEIINKMFESQ